MSSQSSTFLLLLAASSGFAAGAPAPEPSAYDVLWNKAVLLKGTKDDAFQELRFIGREQFDYYAFRNGDKTDSGWANRRSRLGLKGQFLQEWYFSAEFDFNLGDPHPIFNKITDANVKWSPGPEAAWTLGRQGVRFTLDGSTSSLVLPTIDRSAISNNIGMIEESIPGLTFEGDRGKWFYRAGVFTSGSANSSFGRFDAGTIGFVSTGWHFDEQWGLEKAFVRLDALTQSDDPQNATGTPQPFSRNHDHALSLSGQFSQGPWTLNIDLAASKGNGSQSDLKGLEFEPIYNLNEDWQLVFRYTYLQSKSANGIYPVRYEGWVTPERGDRYQEYYLGLNRYFYGHKLKWMLAVEHGHMHDSAADGGAYSGWGFTSGFRVSW
jgi:phosphate-selective porin OprO/OprP